MQQAAAGGATGPLYGATLEQAGGDPRDPANLQWRISYVGPRDPINIAAGILSQATLNGLVAAARGGDGRAQYALASAYLAGLNGPRNAVQSLAWLRQSAAHGHLPADNRLGQYYQFGIGVRADAAAAAGRYQKGATSGDGYSQFNLGLLYDSGVGVPQDWSKAGYWLRLAEQQGMEPATAELGYVEMAESAVAARRAVAMQRATRQWQAQAAPCTLDDNCPAAISRAEAVLTYISAMKASNPPSYLRSIGIN